MVHGIANARYLRAAPEVVGGVQALRRPRALSV